MLILAVLASVACHADAAPPQTETAPGPYARGDVDAIVLGPDDAPPGTAYVTSVSGFQDLVAFARDGVELRHLQDDGFQIGHLALFFPRSHAEGSDPTPLTNRSTIVQGITGLFHDADGAERSLERYEDDLRSRQLPDARDIPADGLGDTSFGLRGTTSDGAPVRMFVWRTGNLILAVSGSGALRPGEVRALADLIDARAVA